MKLRSAAKLKAKPASNASTLTLAELQATFQKAVMSGDDAVLDSILDNSRTNRDVLFGVYRHAYVSRLVDVIRNDHALLQRYLGEEAFTSLARAYVAAHPSRNQNARWYSHKLPEFIADARRQSPELAELAALERAVSDVFDAADAPILTVADLAAVAPEDWEALTFIPHPSARRVDLATNAYALWAALKDDKAPPAAENLSDVEKIIAWRREVTPVMRRMNGEEAMMWNEAVNGVRFGALCELVAVYDDPDTAAVRAAQYLQGWIVSGMLSEATTGRTNAAPRHDRS